jgi:hypothetical protein
LVPLFAADSQLDKSWCLFYHYTFRSGIQFGRDLLFEYGPWGFCLNSYYVPKTFSWALLARGVIAAGIFAGLWRLAKNLGMYAIFGAIWIITVVLWGNLRWEQDGLFFLMCLLPILIIATDKEEQPLLRWEIIVLAAGMAMAALCKFSFMMLGVGTIGLVSLYQIMRLRRAPVLAMFYIGWLLLGWVAAAQSIFNLPRYVISSWELARGYSIAMSEIGPDFFMIPVFLVISAFITILLTSIFWRRDRVMGAIVFIATGVTLFFCFKEGYTRQDGHEYTATSGLASVACMMLPIAWRSSTRAWQRWGSVLLMAASIWCLTQTYHRMFGLEFGSSSLSRETDLIESGWANGGRWIIGGGHIAAFDAIYNQDQDKIRVANPLPHVTGKVDVVGDFQAAAIAAGMDLKEQPVFQSYAASDRRLQEANRRALIETDAAENLLFQNTPIDYRYPSLDGSVSWPQLLSSYEITDFTHDVLVMRRRSQPERWSLRSLGTVECHLNQDVTVPNMGDAPIWANIDIKPTFAGMLESTLFRATEVYLKVLTTDDKKYSFRVIPDMMSSGFLLSPLVQTTRDFAEFATIANNGPSLLPRIKQFSIVLPHTSHGSIWFHAAIKVHFSRLDVPRQQVIRIPTLAIAANLSEMARSNTPPLQDALFYTSDGARALYSHPVTSEKLTVPASATALKFQYGLLPATWDKSQGVIFRISALDADGTMHLLWTRTVAPMVHPEDRAQLSGSLSIAGDRPRTLVFETLPAESLSYCWAYWANVRFEFPPAQ